MPFSAELPYPVILAHFKSTRKGPWARYVLLNVTESPIVEEGETTGKAYSFSPLNGKTIVPTGEEPLSWGAAAPVGAWGETQMLYIKSSDAVSGIKLTVISFSTYPHVRVEGIPTATFPIVYFKDYHGIFEVGRKPNFTVAPSPSPLTDAEVTMATDPHLLFSGTPEPAPTSVFLLRKNPSHAIGYTNGYILVGEYHHTADIYCYKLLPLGEDVILSFMTVPETLEYYHVKGISTDKKVVRDLRFVRNHTVNATRASTGEHLRVYELPVALVREHVGLRLKRNFNPIVAAPAPTAPLYDVSGGGGAGAASGMPPPPTVMDASGAAVPITVDTISHVPITTSSAKSKIIKGIKTKVYGVAPHSTLSPFVARQLLELAQMRKELCPVVAEEFSIGNTAVMPCGHLFAQIAIEESFKKELNRCPACRQSGRPTYV